MGERIRHGAGHRTGSGGNPGRECANVGITVETVEKELVFPHVLKALFGSIRTKFTTDLHVETQSESPVEDVRVPASLANAIFEAAELHRRLQRARHEIGAKISELGLLGDLDGDGKPRERANKPAMK